MSLILYYTKGSAPCSAIVLLAKILKIDLTLKHVDLEKGEQLVPEFLKLNPQHTVPTLIDGKFSLWESRAILTYLFEKYAKQDSLYPKDPQRRAIVNQRLYFDLGTLYQRFSEAYYPLMFEGGSTIEEGKVKRVEEALEFLNTFIDDNKFVTGEEFTLADISLFTTVTIIESVDFNIAKYPNIISWLDRCKVVLPYHEEVNVEGNQFFGQLYKDSLKRLKV